MNVYTYTIHIPKFSLNTSKGMNHFVAHKKKEEFSDAIAWELKTQKITPVKTPVALQFIYHYDNLNFDLDNQIVDKFIIDCLKKQHPKLNQYGLGIIENDNARHVVKIAHMVGNRRDNSIDIIIHELT